MDFLIYYGIALSIISLLFIIKPGLIIKLNKMTERVVFTDSNLFARPVLSGIVFIVLGVFLIYVGFLVRQVRW